MDTNASTSATAPVEKQIPTTALQREARRLPLLRRRPPARIHSACARSNCVRSHGVCNAKTIHNTGNSGRPIVKKRSTSDSSMMGPSTNLRPWLPRPLGSSHPRAATPFRNGTQGPGTTVVRRAQARSQKAIPGVFHLSLRQPLGVREGTPSYMPLSEVDGTLVRYRAGRVVGF